MSTEPASKKPLVNKRFESVSKDWGDGFLTIVRGLASPDRPTRRMSVFFFLSLFLAILSVTWGLQLYREDTAQKKHELTESERSAQNLSDFVSKQAEENKQKASQFGLGNFQIELLPMPGERKVRGLINMAEVDVTIQFDEKETRDYVDAHSVEARNLVASALSPIQKSELLTRDGKFRIKRAIAEKFAGWLPKGKVVDVYFTRLIAT